MKQIIINHDVILGTVNYYFLPPEIINSNFIKY